MAKKTNASGTPGVQKDDVLFETLGKNKKRKKRKIIFTVIAIVLILAILAVVGVNFLQRQVREQFTASQGEVLSYEVTTGSISTVVSGSGSLTDVDLESITVPEGVEITEILVKTNQSIAAGDILAKVDMASVISAMADLQTQIEDLDKQLSDAEEDAADTTIYAGVTGLGNSTYVEIKSGLAVGDTVYYTESQSSFGNFGSFGGMGGMGGMGFGDMGGSGMPDFGNMDFGNMPSGNSGRPAK